jgi:anaerobic magnesium-protoporphyrin IX monomethyl ester cyclase
MAHYDCLLIGHNELDFQDYYNILENMASSSGRDHVAFTDLQLNHVEHNGRRMQAQDILSELYNEGLPDEKKRQFYNGDCFWTAISYLGTYLHRRNYTFDYINLFQFEKEELKRKLKENTYTLIALTGTMYVFEQNIWEVVSFIRRQRKDAKIIAGGPYISKQAEEREPEYLKPLFKYLNADFYCYSREGEQTLTRLIDALKSGADLATIPNLAYRKGRDFVVTPAAREHTPLASNIIDYSLFAKDYARSGWANIRISEGCPYACGFCAFPEHGNERYVIMSLANIERELDAIKASGAITHLFFVDATLNVPKKQFKAMLQMMVDKKYGFSWHCFFRCDQADEETIALMAKAGCIGVFLGLESANEQVLNNMDKSAHKDDFRRTMPWFKQHGIRTMVSVQIGFPGETYESFMESVDFVEEIAPDFSRIQIWFCDPTTPVWRRRNEFKLEGKGYGWSHYTMDAETAVELVVKSFMALRDVTWVPDPGYNWVSFYAMEKLGMSVERQKKFIAYFTAAARDRLLHPNRRGIAPELLGGMRALAQFDRAEEPDMAACEPYSGDRYRNAEAYWVEAFRGAGDDGLVAEAARAGGKSDAPARIRIPDEQLKRVAVAHGAEPTEVLLAVYALVTGAHSRSSRPPLALSLDGSHAFPFRAPSHEQGFGSYLAAVRAGLKEGAAHRMFGFFILSNALRLKEYGQTRPRFRSGFVVDERGDASALESFAAAPAIRSELGQVLVVSHVPDSRDVSLAVVQGADRRDGNGEALLQALATVLDRLAANPDAPCAELAPLPLATPHQAGHLAVV